MLSLIFSLILHVCPSGSINAALDSARTVYAERGERTTIYLAPGVYQEELTIDIPGLRLINRSHQEAKITWYYGHGYQYRSMGDTPNYGGSRTRRWNASVLVTAPDFYAQNITFENSFNLYVSEKEAQDSLVDISQSDLPWTEKERPKKTMPTRPKTVGSTEVSQKAYRERAAAISFTETAVNAHLKHCTAIGKQDVLYGDQGASVYWEGGTLSGAVDFIFGALKLVVDHAIIVANVTEEPNDRCYISAGRSEEGSHGMLFWHCHIQSPVPQRVWLARPWRYWGQTVWAYTTWDADVLVPEAWSTGLTKGQACPNSYEYRSQDGSIGRPEWVTVLDRPQLPDGTKIHPKAW